MSIEFNKVLIQMKRPYNTIDDSEKVITVDPILQGVKMQKLHQKSLIINKDEVNVLILYTGGTFGMMKTADGYKP